MIKQYKNNRLLLRLVEPSDSEAIYAYRHDIVANQYQGWIPDTVEEVLDCIKKMPRTFNVANTYFQFAIILADENRLIGDMSVCFTGQNLMQAEVGCTLNSNFQGKGYATEALDCMLNFLFGELKKHRVIASIDPRNTKSIQLVERLGFRKEAHFKESMFIRGEWVDDLIYAMLEKEWMNRNLKNIKI